MTASTNNRKSKLTPALEDYLETIYLLSRERHVARIKEIALARNVKSASVTPAMKRLADLGMIDYTQREYIELTEEGAVQARRIYAKHQVLARFLSELLDMNEEISQRDACAMEHTFSDQAMGRMVRLFEFLQDRPEGAEFLHKFHEWREALDQEREPPTDEVGLSDDGLHKATRELRSLSELNLGERGKIV
jgi:DtxR family transcriptional regulator, Mn-dependent transcriptional regulator